LPNGNRRFTDVDGRIRSLDADVRGITQDQERVRKNIESLNAVAGQQDQVQKVCSPACGCEAKLVALGEQQAIARKWKQSLETEVSGLIDKLTF